MREGSIIGKECDQLNPNEGSAARPGRWLGARYAGPLFVFSAALSLQLLYLSEQQRDPTAELPIIDAGTYHEMAVRFAEGGPLTRGAFWQPPLFPLFLALVYKAFGVHVLAARLVLALLAATSCLLVAWLGRRAFSARVGVLAGLMLALYGPFVFYATQLLPVGLAILLNLAALALWVRARATGRPAAWTAFGLTVGLATITVPNSAVVLVLAVLERLLAACHRSVGRLKPAGGRHRWASALAMSALALTGAALPVLAVTARNFRASGEWVPISTNGGVNFYLGNNPQSDRTIAIRPGEHWRRFARGGDEGATLSNAERSRLFFGRALTYAGEQPLHFLGGMAHKALQFANAREIPRNVDPYVYRSFSSVLAVLLWRAGPFGFPFGLVAPLACIGLMRFKEGNGVGRRLRGMLLAFAIAYAATVVLFFVTSRYRMPMVPVIIIFAAAGADWLWQSLRERRVHRMRRGRPLLVMSGFLTTLLVVTIVNLPVHDATAGVNFQAELYRGVGQALIARNRLDEAEDALRQALQLDPDSAQTHNLLAQTIGQRGRLDEAESLLRRAADLDDRSADARWLLGDLLRWRKRMDEAGAHYREALRIDPCSPEAHAGLGEIEERTGDFDAAISHYRSAARFAEEPGLWLARLADVLTTTGRYAEAIDRYREAINQGEMDPAFLSRAAWLLATCPQADLRDCQAAIRIAERLCTMTKYEQPVALDTLAAAYAECGQLDEAIRWARKAIETAERQGNSEAADSFRSRLRIYLERRRGTANGE